MKDKLGMLRFYIRRASDDVRAIIELWVERSAVTCEECGAAGHLRRSDGSLRTLCDGAILCSRVLRYSWNRSAQRLNNQFTMATLILP